VPDLTAVMNGEPSHLMLAPDPTDTSTEYAS
jgi:hypothetical protein